MNEETVTISKSEYDRLVRDSIFLGCLEQCGVDNWDGYYEAGKMIWDGYYEAGKMMREDEKSDE